MFNFISWKEFSLVCVLVIILYYILISIYYVKDVSSLFRNWQLFRGNSRLNETCSSRAHVQEINTLALAFPGIFIQFSDEIQAFLQEASLHHLDKEAIIYAIRLVIQKYPALTGAKGVAAVKHIIISECENYMRWTFSEKDVDKIFNGTYS